MSVPTRNNDAIRDQLERDIKQYLKSGGVITICPPSTFSTTHSIEQEIFNKSFQGAKSK